MTATELADGRVILHGADCRDVLRDLANNSIDSIVTDPPYALVSITKRFGKPGSKPAKDVYGRGAAGFMGKTWDTGEVAFSEEFWAECLRVLKPGGHVVAFSGTRTYHRMAVAIEDAGFEIRDQLGWLYGSGFPKSHNQHDEWEGWGTALKPAWEPIALARKPLSEKTVAANLAKWGVGALNIDGCRVGTEGRTYEPKGTSTNAAMIRVPEHRDGNAGEPVTVQGRWPANIVHDGSDEVLAGFPNTKSGGVGREIKPDQNRGTYGAFSGGERTRPYEANEGSAARFFYCAKASRSDRDEGLGHLPKSQGGMVSNTSGQHITRREPDYKPEPRANIHPTVKPTSLMQWLCRLVTPPGGVILDPFMGSGSTGKAAVWEGFRFIGCEREAEYLPIAEARIRHAVDNPPGARFKRAVNDNLPVTDAGGDLFGEAA